PHPHLSGPTSHDDGAIVTHDLSTMIPSERRGSPAHDARRITAPALPAVPAKRHLAWLSLAMFLGMTMWFSATAANAPIVAEFRLTAAETAWLTMAVQGG